MTCGQDRACRRGRLRSYWHSLRCTLVPSPARKWYCGNGPDCTGTETQRPKTMRRTTAGAIGYSALPVRPTPATMQCTARPTVRLGRRSARITDSTSAWCALLTATVITVPYPAWLHPAWLAMACASCSHTAACEDGVEGPAPRHVQTAWVGGVIIMARLHLHHCSGGHFLHADNAGRLHFPRGQ
jgi:hypothetical protein